MSLLDPSLTFASLADEVGLDVRLTKALARLGHARPTLVQSKCLPLAISAGRDLLVRARTGSGKTLAYCLPLLHKILHSKSSPEGTGFVRGIVLVPTKELCMQVYKTLQTLTYYCDDIISLAVLSASVNRNSNKSKAAQQEMVRQEAMLRDRPNVVVATPAGLLTQMRSGVLDLKTSVETLVIDEADLVLSFGYAKDIDEIMNGLPSICQGFLMSATLSPELESLKKVVLHSPAILKLEEESELGHGGKAAQLVQFYLRLPKKDKNLVIYVFLKLGLLKGKGLFFVNTTDGGYRLKLFLEQFHIRSAVLNAELPLRSRLNIIEQFNIGNFDYLIATDESTDTGVREAEPDGSDEEEPIAQHPKGRKKDSEYGVSRGMDFRNVSFVVNVDFPVSAQSYTHRIGRTARGVAKGVALSLVETESKEQSHLLGLVQDEQPTIPITSLASDSALQAKPTMESASVPDEVQAEYQRQPRPLDFDLSELEGFRYRVEDVSRVLTRTAIKETRAAELRAEILNSERLQSHFDENPSELQLLRHDRVATHVSKVQEHLKHVPKYLLPRGMQVADLNRKRKRRRPNRLAGNQRRTDNDPLRSFESSGANLEIDGSPAQDKGVDETFSEFFDDGSTDKDAADGAKRPRTDKAETPKVFSSVSDGTGRSTSGRQLWKEKHGKGETKDKKFRTKGKLYKRLGI